MRRCIAGAGLFLAAGVWSAGAALGVPPDVTLTASTERLILFDYDPGEPELVPSRAGEDYEALVLPGTETRGPEGAPDLPTRQLMFGVPHGAAVELRVVHTGSTSLGSHRLAPVPRWEATADGLGRAIYEESPAYYGSDDGYPDLPARILLDSTVRSRRVVVVELAPFRYRPGSGDLEFLGPMTVALELSGAQSAAGTSVGDDLHEAWFRRALVNYEASRAWREPAPERAPEKASGGFEQGTGWLKLGTTEKGLYRVTGSMLAQAGVNLAAVDPGDVRVFSGGGRPLPEELDVDRIDDGWMEECSIWVRDGGTSGVMDAADEIIFYGLGAQGWACDYDSSYAEGVWWRNAYTDTNVYWLATGGTFADPPRRVASRRLGWSASDVAVFESTPQWVRDEKNRIENFEISYEDGWMYANFDNATHEQLIPVTLEGVDTTHASTLIVRLCGQRNANARHEATVSLNRVPLVTGSWMSDGFADLEATDAQPKEGQNLVGVKVATSDTSAVAEVTLAWMNLRYWRRLTPSGQVAARSPDSTCVAEYRVQLAAPAPVYAFDVTDPYTPVRLDSVYSEGSTAAFRDSARAERVFRYLVASDWESCAYIRPDETSDLRTDTSPADFLIIYHPLFRDAALQLAAHRSADWNVRAVSINDVYDEFSWGLFDPVAIRDFLAFASRHYAALPKGGPGYVLLFGDASYNYRAEGSITVPNYVPSWHGRYRRGSENIYSTDDWYTYLHPSDELMEMAIGRLPVQTRDQAQALVEKIVAYDADPDFGTWRTRAVISADDLGKKCVFNPCEIVHTTDADDLAMKTLPRVFDLKKIYLTDYPYSGECFKREAEADFRAAMDEGALITLFIGHGDRSKMADEELYVWRSSQPPENAGRPTFFLAGSCDVGDFAQPTGSSLGENLLRYPEAGALAVFSSTYLAYSVFNYRVIHGLFANLFPDQRISDVPIGAALMYGKNEIRAAGLETGRPYHNERLELLGDPTLRLATPRLDVRLTAPGSDSIRFVRRDTVSVRGEILQEASGALWFNGTAWIEARATADTSGHWCVNQLGQPLTNCLASHIDYTLPGPVLYRGRATITGGQFHTSFVVPWDTSEGSLARVNVYVSGGGIDGAGAVDSISVGGMAETDDLEGPSFSILVEGNPIGDGSRLSPEGTLRLCFDDESGVNIQGLADTSAVLLVIDSNTFVDLTDLCEYETGSRTRACAEYPYSLGTGSHSLELRAVDNVGNRSAQIWSVTVAPEGELRLSEVFPYPNPFNDGTYLFYRLSRDAEVTVRIFTVSGHLIRKIDAGFQSDGQQHVFWDGRDEEMDEVANGAYLFKIDARSDGSAVGALGKAMKLK